MNTGNESTPPSPGQSSDAAASHPAPTPQRDVFSIDHLQKGFRKRTVRGGTWTIGAEGLKMGLSFLSLAVLARLLKPEDYGMVHQVTAITMMVANFRFLGLSAATIQREQVDHSQVSTLFWINTGVGALFALLIFGASPLIAWFYGDPRLMPIAMAFALPMLFGGLAVQHTALLRRQMRFRRTAMVETIANCTSVAVAIITGFIWRTYWSLVLLHVTRAFVIMLGMWIGSGWTPGLPSRKAEVRGMLGFGLSLTTFNLLVMKMRMLDRILIGKVSGQEPLGFFGNAQSILILPLSRLGMPLAQVALPTLSRLVDQPKRYRRYYSTGILLLSSVTLPAVALCAAAAESIVLTVLGSDWTDSIQPLRALTLMGLVISLDHATRWVYISTGRAGAQLRYALITAPFFIAGMVVGLVLGGPVGLALGMGGTGLLLRCGEVVVCFRNTPVTWKDLAMTLARPACAAAVGAGAVLLLGAWQPLQQLGQVAMLGAQVGAFGVVYPLAWLALPGGRSVLKDLLSLVDDIKRRKPRPRAEASEDEPPIA